MMKKRIQLQKIYSLIDWIIDHKCFIAIIISILILVMYRIKLISNFMAVRNDLIDFSGAVLTVQSVVFAILTVIKNTEVYKSIEKSYEANIKAINQNSVATIFYSLFEIVICIAVSLVYGILIKYIWVKYILGFLVSYCFILMLISMYSSFKLSFNIFILSKNV